MRKTIAIIIAVLFVLAVTSLSFATEEKRESPAPPEEKKAPVKVRLVKGEVTAVDIKAKTITVKGKKGDVVVAADEKMMADIRAGDKVAVKYTEADGKNIAKSIKKAPAKEEMKSEPAEKPMEKK